MTGQVGYSGCKFSCSHSRQPDLDLAMNLTLPFRFLTSQCCVVLLNSMWLARVISSRPSSCREMASVQRHRAVPLGLNVIWVFMLLIEWVISGLDLRD